MDILIPGPECIAYNVNAGKTSIGREGQTDEGEIGMIFHFWRQAQFEYVAYCLTYITLVLTQGPAEMFLELNGMY